MSSFWHTCPFTVPDLLFQSAEKVAKITLPLSPLLHYPHSRSSFFVPPFPHYNCSHQTPILPYLPLTGPHGNTPSQNPPKSTGPHVSQNTTPPLFPVLCPTSTPPHFSHPPTSFSSFSDHHHLGIFLAFHQLPGSHRPGWRR